MTYAHAASGVKKIWVGAVLELLASLIAAGIGVAGEQYGVGTEASTATVPVLTVMGFAALGAAAFSLVALLLQLVGAARAGKDEPNFGRAVIFAVIAMAATVVSAVFRENLPVSRLADTVSSVLTVFVNLFIVWGCIELARRMNRPRVAAYGSRTAAVIILTFVLAQCLTVFGDQLFASAGVWTVVLSVSAMVLAIVQVFAYLGCLKKTVRMLN